ncbi:MAG: HDOD domain-containing protein [candidate division Zixibacteria bacterium]
MENYVESSRALDKIISSIGELPAIPIILSSLMGLTADVNVNIEKITQALMSDQSLTARVLKLSNSSFYGRSKEIQSLKEAVILLGFKTLRSLVVAASTHGFYTRTGGENHNKLWEHTLATAIASRLIAKAVNHPHIEEVFIAGLLHDIGKLVLLQKKQKEYNVVIEIVEKSNGKFMEIEDEIFGFNHTDAGLLILHKWSFPTALINAVFEHHDPIDLEQETMPLSFIVNLGNIFAKKLPIGFNDYRPEDLSQVPSFTHIGLDLEHLEAMESLIVEQFNYERSILAGKN